VRLLIVIVTLRTVVGVGAVAVVVVVMVEMEQEADLVTCQATSVLIKVMLFAEGVYISYRTFLPISQGRSLEVDWTRFAH
jgi:hypothetical protein